MISAYLGQMNDHVSPPRPPGLFNFSTSAANFLGDCQLNDPQPQTCDPRHVYWAWRSPAREPSMSARAADKKPVRGRS